MIRRMQMIFAGVLAALGSMAHAQSTAPAAAAASTIELRISPIIDLHMSLRAAAENKDAAAESAIAGQSDALAAMAALEASLGGPRAWLGFEGNFLDCSTAADVAKVFEQLPEHSGPGQRELRQPALQYAAALARIEPAFLEQHWPAREQQLQQASAMIERDFMPHARACIDQVIAALAMTDPKVIIPVHLTIDGPGPGRASTSATIENRGVVFVALNSASGTQFFETIVHEATHALDVATRDQQHALNIMRAKLVDAGVPRTDTRWRDTWHTIMFITAAAAVRRTIDPKHEDYGVVEKYYDKVAEVAAIERPIWAAYLKGEISREQAIDNIVKAVAAIAPKS